MNRRQLFLTSGLASALSLQSASAAEKITLKKGDTILFQGDSVTDCRRNRKNQHHAFCRWWSPWRKAGS